MGTWSRKIFAVCALFSVPCALKADLVIAPPQATANAIASAIRPEPVAAVPFGIDALEYVIGWPGARPVPDLKQPPGDWHSERDAPRQNVLVIPPGPSSLSLCLWAFGTFGIWQLGRSARNLHWGNLPDWYHVGGPSRIGHATPFDLQRAFTDAPDAFGSETASHPTLPHQWLTREAPPRCMSQFVRSVLAPRPPPVRL